MPPHRLSTFGLSIFGWSLLFAAVLGSPGTGLADPTPQTSKSRVEAALENIATLDRPGRQGYATFSDGNKYVQCSYTQDRSLRYEAAGTLMQLAHVLVSERVNRLAALGWRLDPSFGNYVQTFPAGLATSQIADQILQALSEAYDAQLADLDMLTAMGRQRALSGRAFALSLPRDRARRFRRHFIDDSIDPPSPR
jgi:hypothetical protein